MHLSDTDHKVWGKRKNVSELIVSCAGALSQAESGPAAEITLIKRHHCNNLNTNTQQTINYETLSCSWSSAVTTKFSFEKNPNDIKCKLTGAMCGEYCKRDRGHFYASFQDIGRGGVQDPP